MALLADSTADVHCTATKRALLSCSTVGEAEALHALHTMELAGAASVGALLSLAWKDVEAATCYSSSVSAELSRT